MRKISFLLIAFTIIFSSCGNIKKIKPSNKIVKIAVLAPMSGKYKRIGVQGLIGLNYTKKLYKYLKNGDEIKFEVVDTKSKPNYTKKLFIKLAKKDDIAAIISLMPSDNMLQIYSIFQRYKLPVIATVATNNDIVRDGGYVAQVCMNNHTQALIAAHYIKDEKLIEHVNIFYDGSSKYSISLKKEFKQLFIGLNGKIDHIFDINKKDNLAKIKDMKMDKDTMIFNSASAILLDKILKTKSWNTKILSTDGLLSNALENCKKDVALFDGIYVIEHFSYNIYKNKDFLSLNNFLDKKGVANSTYAFLAYDSYRLLAHALNSCKDYSKECIKKQLQNSDTIQGIEGKFTIENSKSKRGIFINNIENSLLKKVLIID